MNSIQENKISMYLKVRTFYSNNLTVLNASMPGLTSIVNTFNARLDQLTTFEQKAMEANDGFATQKQVNRADMTDKLMQIAGALRAHALVVQDEPLAAKAFTNKSTLNQMRDTDIIFWSENLAILAASFATALVPYGITAAKLTALNSANAKYRASIQTPADQRGESAAAGLEVDKKIIELDGSLRILDSLMESIRVDNSLLYNNYQANRLIDDNASGNTTPDVAVTVAAASTIVLYRVPYNSGRSFRVSNKGNDAILVGLSADAASFTNRNFTLDAKGETNKLSSTLAKDGDFLLVQNTSTNSVDVELRVIE
jgi:hypothetical protein